MKIPEAIIFDWDNTLVDSWGIIQSAMNDTLHAMGQEGWDMLTVKQRVSQSLKDSFPDLFKERWEEARDVFYSSYRAVHLEKVKPLQGRKDMLQFLSDAGIPLAIVSNKNGGLLRREIDHIGWDVFFRKAVGATDAAADKPNIAPVEMVLAAIPVKPSRNVWFVGDAAIDMECAYNAGCLPVLLRDEPDREGEFRQFPPELRFADGREFCHHFECFGKRD